MKQNKIIMDLEFNGLPRYNFTPEITQVKLLNLNNGKSICRNFTTKNPGFARAYYGEIKGKKLFTSRIFKNMLHEIGAKIEDRFFGFSIDTDKEILFNAGITIEYYDDIQWRMRLSNRFEESMAMAGSSLEVCYYFVTGKKITENTHCDIKELDLIYTLYKAAYRGRPLNNLRIYPWGDQAGMPLEEYFLQYRRRADGYRYNNDNPLSYALDEIAFKEQPYWG